MTSSDVIVREIDDDVGCWGLYNGHHSLHPGAEIRGVWGKGPIEQYCHPYICLAISAGILVLREIS